MSDTSENTFDYAATLNLPQTDFPMRAGLPKKEPQIIAQWQEIKLSEKLHEKNKDKENFTLHDGPPYANGHLHIGHALNKILKDIICRSRSMMGYHAHYVPGWDCHGLPIEWKIEEAYRAKGKNKDDVPILEFRGECRDFAKNWVGIQSKEFQRLGVEGDFENPYTTMSYKAESIIANELMKFATSGQLYRGSKPIMWSVVEKTALAEAEVEYHDVESDAIWVKFPINASSDEALKEAFIVIWTTTPWTIPANRAVSFSRKIAYGLYEVISAENDFGPQKGELFILADKLAHGCFEKAKLEVKRLRDIISDDLQNIICDHPLKNLSEGYTFPVPLLDGDHVTDEAGTGFVHTAPGHGRDDFEIWMSEARKKVEDTSIPFTVDDDGYYTKDAPGFEGARVMDHKGKKGDANKRVIEALIGKNTLFARGRLKHTYPHSWRSKKPIIFRNTPQWFVSMDKDLGQGQTLRSRSLNAIEETTFYPPQGQNRLRAMIENRPDWVLSRQRAWGVPICVFTHKETGQIIPGENFQHNEELVSRITTAFLEEGADCWFEETAQSRFLEGLVEDVSAWEKVCDILDVWFDSGCTHAFVLDERDTLKSPADLYLEGSDQHRGWFHSSLLESCGTRGAAPYKGVLTHGFVLDEKGRKMSKSLGNVTTPEQVIQQSGADILRLWVAASDYSDDLKIGKEILKTMIDTYRKLRNTLRWMLGSLAHDHNEEMPLDKLPELELYMLHRLYEVGSQVEEGYKAYDFKKVNQAIINFMTLDLSAFYFDIRKDALYCDAPSSKRRKACLFVLRILFKTTLRWLAPIVPFTAEEAWQSAGFDSSIHLQDFTLIENDWHNEAVAEKWTKIRNVRKVVTGALEIERREKRIGSSLEAAPLLAIENVALRELIQSVDMDDICIVSAMTIMDKMPTNEGEPYALSDVEGVSVIPQKASGKKCARSWKISDEVGKDSDYPEVTLRDAQALRELGIKVEA